MRAVGLFIIVACLVAVGPTGCSKQMEAPGEAGAPRWDRPASREAPAAEALVAAAGPKNPEPAKRAAQAPQARPEPGVLTAGSFDDNLDPAPYRTFLRQLSRDQSARD